MGTGDSSDIDCQARCITVPNPDADAVNKTTECIAECPQGNGTQEETQQYIDCSQKCISDFYLTTTFTGGPTQSKASGTVTATPSVTTVTSDSTTFESTVTPTASEGDSPSATDDSSSSSSTSEGGAIMFAPIGSTGLLGLVAALFAL